MRYTLSAIDPRTVPAVRLSEIVAGGNWQVRAPLTVSVNFTGTTPRLALNTLDPSGLIGGCTKPAYAGSKIAKGDKEGVLAQAVVFTVLMVVGISGIQVPA
jgi:hypothetical protein